MGKKAREPAVPAERRDTVRHQIIEVLERGPHSARDISGEVRIPEKEVFEHLDHIQKTLSAASRELAVRPASCRKCGFLFSKRERFKKPGKCPVCRGESIEEPLFSVRERDAK